MILQNRYGYMLLVLFAFLSACAIEPLSSGGRFQLLSGGLAGQGDAVIKRSDMKLDRQVLIFIEQGKYQDVLELLDRGADPNAKDSEGRTALMYAGITGQTDTMQVLVDRGAQINVKDRWGNTPLHEAIMFGDPEAVRMMIDKGADVNATFYLGPNTGYLSPLKLARLRQRTASDKRLSDVPPRGRLIYHSIKSDYERIIQMLESARALE